MIYGDGIRLRAPERSDIPLFVAWLNDPAVRQGLLVHLPFSQADEENWFEGMLTRPQYEHPLTIEIQQGDAWRPIGNCGYHNFDWRSRAVEVGIFIGDKSCWNRGYGTQVMRLMLQHGFNTLNLNRIALDVYETNPRAVRAYEKAGFVHEGRRRQGTYKDGRYVDILQMSVLRDEWHT
jgi:diamine N-acetyltransferase